jgi:glutaconate CoA-transferase subunit A
MINKVMTMKEAVSKFVEPGDTLFVGGAQHGTPNAAVAEIVRQKINHLTVISVLNNTGTLVGEGLVDKVLTGYSMTDIKRSMHLQRARDKFGVNVEFKEYSHFGIALALYAGYMGVSFLPTQSHLGSDMMKYNDEIQTVMCPFTKKPVAVIKAVVPDVGVIHVQRCDAEGNAQRWGTMGVDFEGINASRKVIITTEKVVGHDVIQRDSNRTLITGCRVSAVVEQPYGAFSTHLVGCYHSGMMGMGGGGGMMQGEEGWENYVNTEIYGVKDWDEYLENQKKIHGEDLFEKIKINDPMYSEPVVSGL